jgi:hypothetical protein
MRDDSSPGPRTGPGDRNRLHDYRTTQLELATRSAAFLISVRRSYRVPVPVSGFTQVVAAPVRESLRAATLELDDSLPRTFANVPSVAAPKKFVSFEISVVVPNTSIVNASC